MKSTRKMLRLIGFITIFAFLGFGCGGGGDGGGASPGISYTGLTSPATIGENNAVDLANGAYMGYSSGVGVGPLSVQSGGDRRSAKTLTLRLPQILEEALHRADLVSTLVGVGPSATQCGSETVYGDCGGSAYAYLCVDDVSGYFNGYFVYSSYCSEDVTISGRVNFSGWVDLITLEFLQLSLTFNNITVVSGNYSCTLAGTIDYDYTTFPFVVTMEMLHCDNSTGKVHWVTNYEMHMTEGPDYEDVEIVSGRYYHPDYGYVVVSTPTPFRIYDYHYWPSEGILLIEGEIGIEGGNTKARLTALSSITYRVEADTDGDDAYDWDSGVLLYLPFPCMNEDWGRIYYVFKDQMNNRVYIQSHGTYVWVSALVDYEGAGQLVTMGMTGPPIDCYNAGFDYAKFDFDMNGTWDYETTNVVGKANIYLDTLTISGVIIDGYAYPDIVAIYEGGPYHP